MKNWLDLQEVDPCFTLRMYERWQRTQVCSWILTKKKQKMLEFVLGSHSVIRSSVELLILCSAVPSKSIGKPASKDDGHSDMVWTQHLGILTGKWWTSSLDLVKVKSEWVKLINLEITKYQSPTFVSQHFSLALECAIACQWSTFFQSSIPISLAISDGESFATPGQSKAV